MGRGRCQLSPGPPGQPHCVRTHTLRQRDRVTDTHPHAHNTHTVPLVLKTTPPKAQGLVALPGHRRTSLHATRRPTAPEPSPLRTCANKRQARLLISSLNFHVARASTPQAAPRIQPGSPTEARRGAGLSPGSCRNCGCAQQTHSCLLQGAPSRRAGPSFSRGPMGNLLGVSREDLQALGGQPPCSPLPIRAL